jgi:uncharacterized repeat protein (TIGR03847 family)
MNESFDLERPDHFTVGAVGPPGQRVFYLQGREARQLVTLKVEKEQIRALADYLTGLLAKLPSGEQAASADVELLEPLEAAWVVASLGVGYDNDHDRILIVANELREPEEGEEEGGTGGGEEREAAETAVARFRVTRAQAAAFVERSQSLMKAGRPICPFCSRPIDADGHVCVRTNGHAAH